MTADPKPAAGAMSTPLKSTVVEVRGLHWATSKTVVEHVLLQRPGVTAVDANAVAQTATVSFVPAVASVEQISGWIRDCGYSCRGESAPDHVCYPMDATLPTHGMRHDTGRTSRSRPPAFRTRPPHCSPSDGALASYRG